MFIYDKDLHSYLEQLYLGPGSVHADTEWEEVLRKISRHQQITRRWDEGQGLIEILLLLT